MFNSTTLIRLSRGFDGQELRRTGKLLLLLFACVNSLICMESNMQLEKAKQQENCFILQLPQEIINEIIQYVLNDCEDMNQLNSKFFVLARLCKKLNTMMCKSGSETNLGKFIFSKLDELPAKFKDKATGYSMTTYLVYLWENKLEALKDFSLDKCFKEIEKRILDNVLNSAHLAGPEFVASLVKKGANVNHQGHIYPKNTALMNVAIAGDTKSAQLLLDNGADVFAENERGDIAYDLARENGNHDLADLLSDKMLEIRLEQNKN